jgi:site-specific DNA recombinase
VLLRQYLRNVLHKTPPLSSCPQVALPVRLQGILDQLAKFERAKSADRTRRGRLRKAREGKVIAGRSPDFGFVHNEARDGYVVHEPKMAIVRRIFEMFGAEGSSVYGVKAALDA